MKKFFLFLVVVVLFVVGGAFFFLVSNLDQIVEGVIEETGTEMLGQSVTVEAVSISLTSGSGEIKGLEINNPDGYTDPNAFSMEQIRLNIDLGSITGSPKRLNEFVLEAPEVYLEVTEDDRMNLEELAAHLQAKIDEMPEPEEVEEEPVTEEEAAAATLLAIDHLRIAGVQLTVRHPELKNGMRTLVLPDIDLKNVGGTEGITGAEIGLVVVKNITKEGLKQALREEVEKEAGKLIEKGLNSLLGE
jgi:hypothetical protein